MCFEDGMMLFEIGEDEFYLLVKVKEVYDVIGVGDIVVFILVVVLVS